MIPGAPFLCLDIGLKRTGSALSLSGLAVQPLQVIGRGELEQEVINLVQEHGVATIIAGIPNRIDDSPTEQAERVTKILERINMELQTAGLTVEIIPYNEYGSTKAAKRTYPSLDDNVASATILLEDFLENAS